MVLVKDVLAGRVRDAFRRAQEEGALPSVPLPEVVLERPQNPQHGDYATPLPLKLARTLRLPPLQVAEAIAARLPAGEEVERVEVAPPGFINFVLSPAWLRAQVDAVLAAGERYGDLDIGRGERVQVEFVSANPTGPLHLGHARGAVLGSTLANILRCAGYEVVREYYINDAGSQIDAFARSLWARYQEALGRAVPFPAEGYRGAYLVDLAREIVGEEGDRLLSLPEEEAVRRLREKGLERMLREIREDLSRIRVEFDHWFSERSLYQGDYQKVMGLLEEGGYLARREGAVWFVSTALGEDKDNVLVRSTGLPTYFASDAAYHYNKFIVRGFHWVINIWGADHQGHIPRVKAVVQALGVDPSRLTILTTQMVSLKRSGQAVKASKRAGEFITLREVTEEIGPDAVRYFFLTRSPEAHMEVDLDLAARQSQENPVYYIQYAHARISGILRHAGERGLSWEGGDVQLLTAPEEMDLVKRLVVFPELVEGMARALEPHRLPHYTLDLATAFHWFYDHCRVVTEDQALSRARLKLVEASRLVLSKCLSLMGMSAPERM